MSYDQFYERQPNGPTAGPVQTSAPSPTLPPSMGTPASAPVGDGTAPVPAGSITVVQEDRYDLAFPIKAADGSDITFLKLRRLKAKEMKGVDPKTSDGKFGGALKFIAEMNGLPADTLDELDAVDVIELVGKVAPFLVRGTGVTPSA
ncbi:phage tail assembly protein [Herbaspirillum rubrisubalbicans]|uniref:Phage tail assembly protein n=2 Tax=Herbaspirillum rubrisubalbicans TaxID=80842 RepID=A0AAD0UDV0_9BURK|nr:phage tail assembly protein [Herbaspirillum rubrisubalbicans]AYR25765.1 hypothetical protein RC54_18970 [Herbaspirillum rubrisubalbicans]